MNSRRKALEKIAFDKNVNLGLWFDKFIGNQDDEKNSIKEFNSSLFNQKIKIEIFDDYKKFFERRLESLAEIKSKIFKAIEIDSRMIIGLGGESVWENAISIHRTYGVPFIPGSALKGLAASYARKFLKDFDQNGEAYKFIFGSQESAGFITFHDALLIPPKTEEKFLHAEIMTVHHQDYYSDTGKPPADWDSPNPINFVSASGKYQIVLTGVEGCEGWLNIVVQILENAFREEGIGAKTSSGYGRASLLKSNSELADEKDKSKVESFENRVNALRPNDVASQIYNNFFKEWENSDFSVANKKKVAQTIIDKVNKDWKNGKTKAWYETLSKFIEGEN